MQLALVSLLLILLSSSSTCQDAVGFSSRCDYKQVQQMFDLAKHGSNGCMKLKSLTYIFGDGGLATPQLTAARFLTANLVFTGTVTHVTKDASVAQGTAYKIAVRPHCFLKGRLSSTEIAISGFQPSVSNGLCLSISVQDGDTGLFFATYVGSDDVRINENGFVKEGNELNVAMQVLRCRENRDQVHFWPAEGLTPAPYCHQIEASESACKLSIQTARVYLNWAFINFESDLKPQCQEGKDYVMQQLLLDPLSSSPAAALSSYSGNGASKLSDAPASQLLTLLLPLVSLTLLP